MKNQTTYALLMRSEEKGRNILETAVYAGCILSAIVAIWQFAQQPVSVPSQLTSSQHVATQDLRAGA
jgi:hypothetical protein